MNSTSRYPLSFISLQFLIVLCFIISAICLALLTHSIYLAAVIVAISAIFYLINKPRFSLSLVGFSYPLMFIIIDPAYQFFFATLYASTWACGIITFLLILRKKAYLELRNFYPILSILFTGTIVSSVMGDSNPVFYRTKIIEYLMYISLFIAAVIFLNKHGRIRYFTVPFLAALSILSALLLFQFFGGLEVVYNWSVNTINRNRLYYGEGANLSMLANLYLYALPILFFKILLAKHDRKFLVVYVSLFFLNLIPFILFQSRSSYLGLAVGLFAAVIVFKPIRINIKVITIMCTLLGMLYFATANMQEFLIVDRLSGATAQGDAGLRLVQIKAVLRLLLDHPFGISRDNYYALISTQYGGFLMSPHNLLLANALKIGFIGLIGYIGLVGLTLKQLLKIRKQVIMSEGKALITALFAGIIAYLIHNTVHNPGYQFETWVFLGIAVTLSSPNTEPKKS